MRTAERREHVWGWRWGTAPERDARGNAQSLQKRIAEDVPTPVPKLELEGRSKNETQKCEEDEIKGIQKWSRKFREILVLVYKMFPTRSLLRTCRRINKKGRKCLTQQWQKRSSLPEGNQT